MSQAVARNDYGRFASAFQTIKSKPDALGTRRLDWDNSSSNNHPNLSFCSSMVFSENRYPLFRIVL